MKIQYCHQVKPNSEYYCFETREAEVIVCKIPPDETLGETEYTYDIRCPTTDEIIGCGESVEDAIHDACYRLMDKSREEYLMGVKE